MIFEPFTQGKSKDEDFSRTKKEGTGLGLTIATRLVELMGGELAVESPPLSGEGEAPAEPAKARREPRSPCLSDPEEEEIKGGKGSRFFFTVPLELVESTTHEVDLSRTGEVPDSRKRIPTRLAEGYQITTLVVDDNKENREVLAKILEDIEVVVITAEDGQQAVEITLADKPDIILMDIWMPKMDGLQAAQQILNECGEDIPKLVAVSASVLAHEQQRYFDSGFDDFIPKPVDEQRVYDCLATLLHVEYEYDDDDDVESLDVEKIVLPEELFLRISEAAELGRVAELENSLDEMRQIGAQENLLAERLHELSRNFDMEGILEILEEINHE